MGVTRHDPAAVIEREHVAVALFPLHVGDDAGGWGLDLGARLRRHVDPLVRAGEVQNRVDAHGRRSEEHTSELQSQSNLVCRLLLEKKNKKQQSPLPSHRTLSTRHSASLPHLLSSLPLTPAHFYLPSYKR